jgi:hypothetical protein
MQNAKGVDSVSLRPGSSELSGLFPSYNAQMKTSPAVKIFLLLRGSRVPLALFRGMRGSEAAVFPGH